MTLVILEAPTVTAEGDLLPGWGVCQPGVMHNITEWNGMDYNRIEWNRHRIQQKAVEQDRLEQKRITRNRME